MFKKKWPFYVLAIYAVVGLLNAFIANEKPVFYKNNNGSYCPACSDFLSDITGIDRKYINLRDSNITFAIYPPVKYSFNYMDAQHSGYKSPAESISAGHLMGTDQLGRDVFAGLIRGCFTSLKIGLFATIICAFLGIFIGMIMAYYGDEKIRFNFFQMISLILGLFLIVFYLFYPLQDLQWLWLLILILFIIVLLKLFTGINLKKIPFPLGSILNKIIEVRRSIPTLIWILVLIPLFQKPSMNNIIMIIVLLGWTTFARHVRAEVLTLNQRNYVNASKLFGADFFYIARKHFLPNLLPTLIVLFSANFVSNILIESSLSFLGIGLPPEEVSWGNQLSEARKNHFAWWYFLFPGMALFFLVFSVNQIKE